MGNEFLVKSKGNVFNLKSQETNSFKLNKEKGNSFNVDSCDTADNSSDISNKPSYAVDRLGEFIDATRNEPNKFLFSRLG